MMQISKHHQPLRRQQNTTKSSLQRFPRQKMNALVFISSTFPLHHCRHHPASTSRPRSILFHLPPRATANKDVKSLDQLAIYSLYTAAPFILTNPLSALAQTAQSADSSVSVDPSQVTQSDLDVSLTSRILGTTVLVLLVIATVGVIILSIENFIVSRDDKKHRQWVQDRIDGKGYPKNMWSPDVDTTFPQRANAATTPEKKMNREMRRMEKRIKDKEERDKKRKEKLAKERAEAKGEKKKSNT